MNKLISFITLQIFLSCLMLQHAEVQQKGSYNPRPVRPPCMECIRIRVGLPKVEQGPGPGIPDTLFTEIQLPNGRFRGFASNATTYAIDGASPWDMTGTPVPVLGRAPRGEYGESGQWMNHVERRGKAILGWVHDETGDGADMGLKSMSLAVSEDDGKSWRRLGQFITGREGVVQGKHTGIGDCGAVDGKDGYYYTYCLPNRQAGVIAARAPVSNPEPGNWKKYFNGSWSQPGLRGDATKLQDLRGAAAARWTATGETIILGAVPGGKGIYLSNDHVNFTAFPMPLIPGNWSGQKQRELVAYTDLLDASTGGNQLGDHWMLTYLYVQPNEDMHYRYLVFRPVEVSRSRQSDEPQAGILLARWYNTALHDRWSTTAAVPPVNGSPYAVDAKLGYLLTVSDPKQPSIELEECLSKPGLPLVHTLMQKMPHGQVCENQGYTRSRTAGFVYSSPQPGAQPLYSCFAESGSHFASNREDCDHLGKKETLLGYDSQRVVSNSVVIDGNTSAVCAHRGPAPPDRK